MSHTLGALALPADLVWRDEFAWSAIERKTDYAVNGALIIDVGERLAGRPITLVGDQSGGWIRRADLLTLQALANNPTGRYTLTLADGRIFPVAFSEGGVMAEPVVEFSDPGADTWYVVTIKLMEI